MSSNKTTAMLLTLLFIFCTSCFAQQNQEGLIVKVLESSLEAAKGGDYTTIDVLTSSVKESENPTDLYISLLDYYLGAGAGETLEDLITQEGTSIVPNLLKKKNSPLNCLKEYEQICTDSLIHRNKRIERLIKEISNP